MEHWIFTYPHKIHASVLLLDGKIENWKIGERAKPTPFDWTHSWKDDRLNDYTGECIEFVANTPEEHDRIFHRDAVEWIKQWEFAEDYMWGKP